MPRKKETLEAIRASALNRERFRPREDRGELPRAGDIRLVRSLDPSSQEIQRLVLVLRVRKELNYAEVCLMSNEQDMMSDFDALLSRHETGLPFDLVAELDLVAPIYLIQACSLFGRIESTALIDDLLAATAGDLDRLRPSDRGLPIRGPEDPRWALKEDELSLLQELSHRCARDIVEGSTEFRTVVDPALTTEAMSSLSEDPVKVTEDLLAISEAAQGAVASPRKINELLERLADLFAIDPTLQLAMQPLLEASLSLAAPSSSAEEVSFSPTRSSLVEEASEELNLILSGLKASWSGSLLRVLTADSAWSEGLSTDTLVTVHIPGQDPLYADAVDPRRRS